MALVYSKWPTFFISRHSKIYPNWDFWEYENIPSGNPVHFWSGLAIQRLEVLAKEIEIRE
jgi:hypothetical protein